jgi:hypothetical protein
MRGERRAKPLLRGALLGLVGASVPLARGGAGPLVPEQPPEEQRASIDTNSWCPGQQDLSTEELLKRGDLKWLAPYDKGKKGRCDLARTPWLIIVSLGGRTGSSTVLDMVNAHPAFNLAGEDDDQIQDALSMWNKAALQPANYTSDSWGRGELTPYDLLCDIQAWFEDIAIGRNPGALKEYVAGNHASLRVESHPSTVVGWKGIHWGDNVKLLNFMNAVFPCHRLIFSDRPGDWKSPAFGNGDNAGRARAVFKPWSDQREGWQDKWINLYDDGFHLHDFNEMLSWFGEPESGCHYTNVLHANADGGYDKAALDSSGVFGHDGPGKCQLTVG